MTPESRNGARGRGTATLEPKEAGLPPPPDTSEEGVRAAVAAAREAAAHWSTLPYRARARHVLAVRDLLVEHRDDIVETVVAETGKLPTEALVNELVVVSELIGWYARHGASALAPRRVSPGLLLHKRAEVRYEPLGVVGVISPWNYPLVLSLGPVVTALFAGNTVVLKPSEVTPHVGLAVGRLFREAGAHPDIFQVVTGAGDVGERLVRSGVDKVLFTGSVRSGKAVMKAAADSLTPVVLELGGKDPLIVCEDADLDRAASAAVWGAFTNSGQTCMAVERVYVRREVYDEFVERVVAKTERIRQGEGRRADIGSMTHPRQLQIVEEHLSDALERGAKVLCGGARVEGLFRTSLEPTVLVGVDHTMAVMRDETFGPLLPIMAVDSDDEALRLANDSTYGLNASVWTRDPARGSRLADGLASGSVCVNDCMVNYAMPALPFGGVKQSGLGHAHGVEGLREMSALKAIAIDRLGLRHEPQWFPLTRMSERIGRFTLAFRGATGLRARLAALTGRRKRSR